MRRGYIFYLLLLCLLGAGNLEIRAQAPAWAWAEDVHTGAGEVVNDVAVDPNNGDVVAVGVFNSNLSSFYGLNFLTALGGGFVAKYTSGGNVIWAFPIGNNQDDGCRSVTVAASGNIYVTGYFENIADFKGTSVVSSLMSSSGGKDIFVAKYNPSGQLVWARRAGGSGDDEGAAIGHNTNYVFVTGYFTGSGSFSGIPTVSAMPGENLFVASYDANGNIQWLADGGAGPSTFARDITADNADVYVTGDFKGSTLSIYGYTGTNVANLSNPNPSSEDAFVLSFSVSGPFNWLKGIHSNSPDFGRGIAENANGVYVTGSISAGADFPSYVSNPVNSTAAGLDMYVAQLDKATGNTKWVLSESGASNEEGMAIEIDTVNALAVTGYFQSSLTYANGPTLTSTGNEDVFITLYSDSGKFMWANQAGDNGADIPYGVSTYSNGDIYLGGEYANNAVFNATTLAADGPPNAFVAKIGCVALKNNQISTTQTICEGQTPAMLNGTYPTGGSPPYTYLWQQSPDSINWVAAGGTNNGQNYSPGALSAKTYFRRVISSLSGCIGTDTTAGLLITVDPQPTLSIAGADSSVCVGTSLNLWANTPTVGTGLWTLVSGTATITTAGSPTTSVTMGIGAHSFAWTISNGVCASSSDTVEVKVYDDPTTPNAGNDSTHCSSTYTLNANTPTNGAGTWSVIAGSASVTAVSSPNSGVTGLTIGANTFVWTISNGPCASRSDTVTITRDAPPTSALAGSDQVICASTDTLNGNIPSVGSGSWNVLSGGATVSNPTQNNSAVTGLATGSNTFEWVIMNGTCPASRDTVNIQVDTNPTPAAAGNDQTICSSSYTLTGNTPSVGSGTWTVYSGGSTVVAVNSPGSAVNNLSVGNNVFVWTTSNGVCPSSSDSVAISVDASPSASFAGNPQTLCNDSANLNAAIPTVGTGTWSVVSGGSTISNPAQNNSLVYNLNPGMHVFMWSVGNGVCPISTSTVAITVDTNPSAAFAGTDQTICSSTATLVATAPATGVGSWNTLLGGATVATSTANTTSVSGLSTGINTFEWVTTNGTCPASRDTVQITVDASPSTSNAGNPQSICSASVTLNAVQPPIGTGNWNVLSGGATVLVPSQNNSSATGLSLGANGFEWVVSNGTCPPSRDTVVITVDADPSAANAGIDQILCASTSTLNATVPVIGTGNWTTAGSATVANSSQNNSVVNGLVTGQNLFIWTISNGTCPSTTDTVKITVDAMPSTANAGPGQSVCSTTTNLGAVIPSTGSGSWTVVQGGALVSFPSSATSIVNGLSIGMNIFQWTVSNGTCPSNSDTVSIFFYQTPSSAIAGSDQLICSAMATLSASGPSIGAGSWSVVTGPATVGSPSSPSTNVNNLVTGQNIFAWTVTNGVCPASADTVIITVSPPPSTANAGPDQNVCINAAATNLAAVVPAVGNGIWTKVGGSAVIANPTQTSSGVSGLSVGFNLFVWTVSNSVCPASTDTVRVLVSPLPTYANAGFDASVSSSTITLSANTPTIGNGTWSLVSGSGTFTSVISPNTNVSGLGFGDNVFGWTISNGICPDSYDEVIIHVNDLVVPNGFSPNGDFVNDVFEIPGIDIAGSAKLEVFNRWGNLVYENDDYKNNWAGKNLAGEDLTDDTYYYTLVIAKTKVYKGFLVLKRK